MQLITITLAAITFAAFAPTISAASPANQPPVTVGVEIDSFTVDAAGAIPTGRIIHVSLMGSPGGKATFAIPNVIGFTAMKETSPGLYQGQYKTSPDFQVVDAKVIGQLIGKDGTMAPVFASNQQISIDAYGPKLVHRAPTDNEYVIGNRPVIFCGFDDGAGTGINPGSVRLQLDGVDVADKATLSPFGITYLPPAALANGIHALFVSVADQAGNQTQNIWHFTIIQPRKAPTFTSDKPEGMLAGDKMNVTLIADPGLNPVFRIEPLNQTFKFTEVEPGHYTGTFTPRPGDSIAAGSVVARFNEEDDRYMISLGYLMPITVGNPVKPTFMPEEADDVTSDGFQLRGRAPAYDRIVYKINYRGRGLSGEFPFTGTAFQATTCADAKGDWHVGPIKLDIASLLGKNLDSRLTMEAYTVDAEGNESFPTTDTLDISQ